MLEKRASDENLKKEFSQKSWLESMGFRIIGKFIKKRW
jgi:hypothetical protein